MERLRLAAIATRFYRVLSLARLDQARQRRFAAGSIGRPADPEEMRNKYEPEPAERYVDSKPETGRDSKMASNNKGTEPLAPPRPPYASSHRLESIEVTNPTGSQIQKRRQNSILDSILKEINCTGLDGTPWPKEQEKGKTEGADKNDYYRHHKASPLSEIEIADTRKPITRATDGTAGSGGGRDVMGWLPEQLDTAEEALRRARRIWEENAMRGDPDSPHGRVLRVLRGEWF